ncbi:MAG: metal-dependent transcriptional regulator [Defluviitaleaceae bacterium]|nr:metal-dependent transcriptional regulator [Defluviitaleaceae bacterium]
MKIQESAENYLETILILGRNKSPVRSVDISNELNYSKPSVSVAMKKLRLDGYVEIDENGFVILTESGRKIAEAIHERHEFISNWLVSLGVDKDIAAKDACKIEHIISEQSFKAIREHINTKS